MLGLLLVSLLISIAACSPQASPSAGTSGNNAKPGGEAEPQTVPADYFAGKTITVISEYSAGGPADVFARLIAQGLQKQLPGQPTVIVENRPGAGGVIGRNQVYTGKNDGTLVGVFTAPLSNQVFGEEGVQYDSTKFVWLGGVVEPTVLYVQKSIGVNRAQDLPKANQEIVVGGLAPNNNQDLVMRTFLHSIDVKYRWLTGFPGGNDVYAAALRDEVNFGLVARTALLTAIRPHVEQGTFIPLVQSGVPDGVNWKRDPHLPNVPLQLEEVVDDMMGSAARQGLDYRASALLRATNLTRGIVLPPGVSPGVAAAYRKAVLDLTKDAEFQSTAATQSGGVPLDIIPGEETQRLVDQIFRTLNDDPEALAHLKRLANDKP